jgi:hypothetical protein
VPRRVGLSIAHRKAARLYCFAAALG